MLSQKVLNAAETGGIQALKSKWWEEGECTNNAIVGSSAEKSMQLDIPHLGKTFKHNLKSKQKKFFLQLLKRKSDT